jgi:hypothetical protein
VTNILPIREWLDVIRDEYLDRFVKDGGSSIKFAVPTGEDSAPLVQDALARMASNLGYKAVTVDSAETRVQMPQEIFFRIASQIDWRLLARRMVLRLCEDLPYQTGSIDPEAEPPILQAISAANAVEESQIALDLRRALPQAVTRNQNMSRDFRLAMTHLCLTEMGGAGQNLEAAPLIEWLTGRSRRVSNVRAYLIYNSISRTNARHFLESLLYWVRHVGHAGTVVILNNSRLTLRRNPRDGLRFYSRSSVMDHYELLREFIDSTDRLEGLLMVVLANEGFLDPDEQGKGYVIYRALMGRIADEVRARSQANPMSTLVRLADTTG